MPSLTIYVGTSSYLKILQEIEMDRQRSGDGVQLRHVWEFSRLLTFIHRPNIFTRANLRNALDSLSRITSSTSSSSSSSSSSSGPPLSSNNTEFDLTHTDGNTDSMGQCVGVHVRHGDSSNDIRGRARLDRSLSAHIACARQLIR